MDGSATGPTPALLRIREEIIADPANRDATAAGLQPLKARLLDQRALAGIGNLLADEILWRAAPHPARRADDLRATEQVRLLDALRDALRSGGVHALTLIPHRRPGGSVPARRRPHVPQHRRRPNELVVLRGAGLNHPDPVRPQQHERTATGPATSSRRPGSPRAAVP